MLDVHVVLRGTIDASQGFGGLTPVIVIKQPTKPVVDRTEEQTFGEIHVLRVVFKHRRTGGKTASSTPVVDGPRAVFPPSVAYRRCSGPCRNIGIRSEASKVSCWIDIQMLREFDLVQGEVTASSVQGGTIP